MLLFQKRGNRIRASDKSLVFRFSAGSLLLLFLAVVLLLNLKTIATTDWKSVHFLQDGSVHLTVTPYMIISVIAALLVCGAAALLFRRFQYDRVKQLFHRQKLAKMILENGWRSDRFGRKNSGCRGEKYFKRIKAGCYSINLFHFLCFVK